jgi:uncharacterized protein (DUF433 family)
MGLDQSSVPLGVGMYSFVDAANLIGAPVREVRRWVVGYDFGLRDGRRSRSTGLWPREFESLDGVSFRDLLELRFVKAFRKHGVSLQAIREAAVEARKMFDSNYPFTMRRFQTDGRAIFVSVHDETGDESLVDIVKHQDVFREIVGPSLYEGIDFDNDGAASRWYPVEKSKAIVLDPARSFGHPLLTQSGIPTIAVARAVRAEDDDVSVVAKMFGISPAEVRQALAFEERLQATG